ncbi:MAG: hypothetical protein PHG32_09710, partial [Candidatus Cloacimonetes bacterium]|nr:hypothetical protein [Candidatus Cloacimonadota bacterium]
MFGETDSAVRCREINPSRKVKRFIVTNMIKFAILRYYAQIFLLERRFPGKPAPIKKTPERGTVPGLGSYRSDELLHQDHLFGAAVGSGEHLVEIDAA